MEPREAEDNDHPTARIRENGEVGSDELEGLKPPPPVPPLPAASPPGSAPSAPPSPPSTSPPSSPSNNANTNSDKPGKEKLRGWLNRHLRIKMTDGRILTGAFLCTDRDANVILGLCSEYLSENSEARALGLVMVPGRHIVTIHLDS